MKELQMYRLTTPSCFKRGMPVKWADRFNIASDGTFALDVYLNCNPTSTMECLGYVFVLVDSTKTEKKDQIKIFLSWWY